MTNYRVAEIFCSVNGEGPRSGQLATFIRMQGCNLHCSYCDTEWANFDDAKYHWTSADEIAEIVRAQHIKNVTLTGGEPLIQENIEELIKALTDIPGVRLEIETNGSVPIADLAAMDNRPTFTMDYKLPGSGMEDAMFYENFKYLTKQDTVKFVAGDRDDLVRTLEIINRYELTEISNVHISPVYGKIDLEDIVSFMKSNNMNDVTLKLQIHKIIWDSELRGV